MNVQSPPNYWWSILRSVVFGSSSSSPPLVSEGGGLACESVGKGKQARDFSENEKIQVFLLII